MTLTPANEFSPIISFGSDHGCEWDQIKKASQTTKDQIQRVRDASIILKAKPSSSDIDLVVFGSLARQECTNNSDGDWTMLIDGPADAGHLNTALILKQLMEKADLQVAGQTGMFGQITISHTLIHQVGGQEDTNHNLTKRILLLLESEKILLGTEKNNLGTAYERVLKGIIHQYIENDSGFLGSSGKDNVPRFLLNDIIRYWRTICVDFASKQKHESEIKWSLRNVKLRMSRKLIFVKGLLMCYASYKKAQLIPGQIEENIFGYVQKPALLFIFDELIKEPDFYNDMVQLFTAYNKFLGILDNDAVRDHLKNLPMKKAYKDDEFSKAREISHQFQNALQNIFLTIPGALREFTLKYGVF